MSHLCGLDLEIISSLQAAVEKNNLKAITELCASHSCPNMNNIYSHMELSQVALENNNLDIFKIVFTWSRHNGSIWLFHYAITYNQLLFVQFLFPFVQDDLDDFDRNNCLENTKGLGFEALHTWLEHAFYPQIASDQWQNEWGFDLELLFTAPSIYELEQELNTKHASGLLNYEEDQDSDSEFHKFEDEYWDYEDDECRQGYSYISYGYGNVDEYVH
jgi:hypothetical protein